MLVLYMVMLIVVVFLSMDHFLDETRLDQKRQRPINSRFGDSAPIFPKPIGEFVWFKMAFCA
jgi:hypothetical protein